MPFKELWKENFSVLPSGVTENVKRDSFYTDGWEAYVAKEGFSQTDNYFIFENGKLKIVKSQGEKRDCNIMARKTLPQINYEDIDEVVIEFDYSIDRPYNSYAFAPVIDIINEKGEQIYGLAFGSLYYGCFVIPNGVDSVRTQGSSTGNEDNERVIARNNNTYLSLCDGQEMHIRICINFTGGYSETTISKNGVTYKTPTRKLPLDTRLSSLNITKIGLYAANTVQEPYATPVVSTFDNITLLGRGTVLGSLTRLANAVREKTGTDKTLSLTEMAEEIKGITPAEDYMEDKVTDAVNDKIEILRGCFFSYSSVVTAKFQNVKTVNYGAFSDCNVLTTVVLPSVTHIKSYAFGNSSKIVTVVIGTENCVLEDWTAFVSTPIRSGKGTIYVPDDAVETYKTDTNWSIFADCIRPLSEWEG